MAEEGNPEGETITLRVKDQTGDEMFFKVNGEKKKKKQKDD